MDHLVRQSLTYKSAFAFSVTAKTEKLAIY